MLTKERTRRQIVRLFALSTFSSTTGAAAVFRRAPLKQASGSAPAVLSEFFQFGKAAFFVFRQFFSKEVSAWHPCLWSRPPSV